MTKIGRLQNWNMFVFFFALFLGSYSVTGGMRRYDGYQVVRIIPETEEQLETLMMLNDVVTRHLISVDVWKSPIGVNIPVDINFPREMVYLVRLAVGSMGMTSYVIIENVQNLIDQQMTSSLHNRLEVPLSLNLAEYHTLEEIYSWINQITLTYSALARIEEIAISSEDRPVKILKLSTNMASKTKPVIWIQGGIHAREWISPAVVIYMTNQLLEQYGQDADVTDILDKFDFHIIPVLNVDGYKYSWEEDRLWRKSRSKQFICTGVDMNRNWKYKWCLYGSSPKPCFNTYCGKKPFSEPEIKAVATYILSLKDRVKAFMDIHSYGQVWITPWGYTFKLPQHFKDHERSSIAAVEALESIHGTLYKHGTISNVLYLVSGGSIDWAYAVAKIKYALGIELRDTGEFGFLLPADQIVPTGEETFAAVLAFANWIHNNP